MVLGISEINFISVLFAGLAGFLLSTIWYSPLVYGKAWMEENKDSTDGNGFKRNVSYFIIALISCTIGALILDLFLIAIQGFTIIVGAQTGLIGALGFSGTSLALDHSMKRGSWKLFRINLAHNLAIFMLMGSILGYWR